MTIFTFRSISYLFYVRPIPRPADGGCVERPLKQYCEANEQKLGGAVSRGKKLDNLEITHINAKCGACKHDRNIM